MEPKISFKDLPHKTIERLSQYRRALLICEENGRTHIYSHEIANLQHITPVQVRRDLMLIGYSGTLRKGYNISELIELIGTIIDSEKVTNVALVGVGNLGRALIKYFNGKRHKLYIAAGIDINPEKAGKIFYGIPCYSPGDMEKVIKEHDIRIGILTVPRQHAVESAERLVNAGIKGIVNYTNKPLDVPEGVYLEEYDMVTTLEKVAFYVKLAEMEKKEEKNTDKEG